MIRPAQLADLRTRGADLFAAAAAELGQQGRICWPALEQLEESGALLLLAVEHAGELVGHCCAVVSPDMWTGALHCTTLSVFVRPEHRGRYGLALLRELAREAAARGAPDVRVQALPGSRLARLLELHGFLPCSIAFAAPNMQYSAGHGRSGFPGGGGSERGIRRVRRRTAGERATTGPA